MLKETKLRTVKKWKEEFNVGLEYSLRGDFVTAIQYKLCMKWESCIKSINSSNDTGSRRFKMCRKKHTKKHLESASHKKAADCMKIKNLGIEKSTEKVINETPIGKSLKQMDTDDKKALVIKFNTAYYLAKNERLCSNYSELIQ